MTDNVAPIPPKKSSKFKGCLMWGGGIFIGLAVLGAIFGEAPDTTKNTQDQGEQQESEIKIERMQVSADQIVRAFEANELAAERRFKDTPLAVSGILLNINAGISEDTILKIGKAGDYEFAGAQAGLDSDHADWVAGLRKGQQVTLDCAGAGEIIGQAVLKDCSPAK